MKINSHYVWVFDLDDTLYSELEYQISGYSAINEFVNKIYQKDVSVVIDDALKHSKDVLSEICLSLSLPMSVKETLLWIYRTHTPKINLYSNVDGILSYIESNYLGVLILTDGRSISQRQKVISLGIERFEILVSEEWLETKPEPKRFDYIEKLFPNASGFVYVGDNVKKDFITPNHLGWLTIGLKDSGKNIHNQEISNIDDSYLPKFWITNFYKLQDFLC